ncbi:hypothetical protein ID852_15940 [Xenorhabdus sp. 42]|nr:MULTISPECIES: hypothetical protein [Xenorhabdus]MBD2803442.1 hypothetical protein [Xenorhabdus sp. ZM]MBD2822147.1 hypothetical protein [Xenorhabdus sp. 42]MBD2826968.1 hypothetical protein [Xenorhabdus sp. 5]
MDIHDEPIIQFINEFLPTVNEWYFVMHHESDKRYKYSIFGDNHQVLDLLIQALDFNNNEGMVIMKNSHLVY